MNAVIGDASLVAAFGRAPDARTNEELRIRTHLEYVLHVLQSAVAVGDLALSALNGVQTARGHRSTALGLTGVALGVVGGSFALQGGRTSAERDFIPAFLAIVAGIGPATTCSSPQEKGEVAHLRIGYGPEGLGSSALAIEWRF